MPTLIESQDRVMESGHGREPAICELRCLNCGDGMVYDQRACLTCGEANPRFAHEAAMVTA